MLENSPFQVTGYCMRVRKFRGVRKEMAMKWQTDAEGLPFHFTESRVLHSNRSVPMAVVQENLDFEPNPISASSN
eukprot:COSAG02_NODE_607_length_19608_cov_33.568968_13_plen_75_part_00